MDPLELAVLIGVVVAAVAGVITSVVRTHRREQRDARTLARAVEENLHLPPSLHPVVDTDLCMGSLACIKACPEGDILGVVDGAARLIEGSHCIGHGKCADECPVGAIRLVVGTRERGVDLPEVDERFESSRRGVHIIGELGGMGLIKNAITQGLQVAEHLAKSLPRSAALEALEPLEEEQPLMMTAGPGGQGLALAPRGPAAPARTTDVVIVGAGPAGLAAALGLREAGLSIRILEQGKVGGTIAHYPRGKVVMTDTVKLPGWGKFGAKTISKESLLGTWHKIVEKNRLPIEEGAKVTGISGSDGAFLVETSRGAVAARKVILATGVRGSPRMLGVPGEELPKVTYSLIDAEEYAGLKVLVVGGGDSAIEAAVQLSAHASDVTVSYRQKSFGKCREANRRAIAELAAAGKLRLLMESQVAAVEPRSVRLSTAEGELELINDKVVACLGGELPAAFLKSVGVSVRRHHGEEPGRSSPPPPPPPVPSGAAGSGGPRSGAAAIESGMPLALIPLLPVDERRARPASPRAGAARGSGGRSLAWVLLAVGLLITFGLAAVGGRYYLLSHAARRQAPMHEFLRPSGMWGHGVGIIATLFMLSNFLYAARKRLGALRGVGSIRNWLTWHVFVGLMSPVAIAFHAAFESNNLIATTTYISLLVVVGTGLLGRYVYGIVPGAGGGSGDLAVLRGQLERQREAGEHVHWPMALHSIWERAAAPTDEQGSLLVGLLTLPLLRLRDRLVLRIARRSFASDAEWREAADGLLALEKLQVQVRFYRQLRRFLSIWRSLHVVIAVLLVGVMTLHVGISLYLGYAWIFR